MTAKSALQSFRLFPLTPMRTTTSSQDRVPHTLWASTKPPQTTTGTSSSSSNKALVANLRGLYCYSHQVVFEFESEVIEWRGPAPFYFARTPETITREIEESAGHLSYGWGCIPATVTIGDTSIATALIPRDGSYFVPLKKSLRAAENIDESSTIAITLKIG